MFISLQACTVILLQKSRPLPLLEHHRPPTWFMFHIISMQASIFRFLTIIIISVYSSEGLEHLFCHWYTERREKYSFRAMSLQYAITSLSITQVVFKPSEWKAHEKARAFKTGLKLKSEGMNKRWAEKHEGKLQVIEELETFVFESFRMEKGLFRSQPLGHLKKYNWPHNQA